MRILAVIHESGRHLPDRRDQRFDRRRPIDLNARFLDSDRQGTGCLLSDISVAGFRARLYGGAAPARLFWLCVPGFPALPARIVWRSGKDVGCEFDHALDPALLDRLLEEAPQIQ